MAIPARVSNLSAGSMQALASRLQAALGHISTATVTASPQAFSPLPVLLRGLAARVLASRPPALIADEPTAQLDSVNARQIMRLLRAVADAEGVSVLVATHDQEVLAAADRVLRISDGVVAPAVPAS